MEVEEPELASAVGDNDRQRVDDLIKTLKIENGRLTRKRKDYSKQ
jgi:hypothetical protein